MPFTVITLKKVPDSLRGDLTRWMQEITTGVYVGSFNSRVREFLWKRVTDSIGNGEAVICYSCRNEIGYSFCTYNTERKVVDYDGIPLVLIPEKNSYKDDLKQTRYGFSNASKYHQASRKARVQIASDFQLAMENQGPALSVVSDRQTMPDLVFLDIESTGLNSDTDMIIEIGAIRISNGKEIEFHRLIRSDINIPDDVCKLTGITDDMLRNGSALEASIRDLESFIQGTVLVGYNISFDIRFLNKALEKYCLEPIHNKTLDLLREAKKRNSFQINYKLETTLKEYGIDQRVLHRALEDARLTYELYIQMGLKQESICNRMKESE